MSADDAAGLTDEVLVELNGRAVGQPEPLPARPAASADKAKWVEYVVALGADRAFVSGDSQHYDEDTRTVVVEPGLSRDQLVELADRLGG